MSVGDKILPTNPSARDRRALQNKITSRMVNKTFNGNLLSRRRLSDASSDDSAYASKGPSEIPSPKISSPVRQLAGGQGGRKRGSTASPGSATFEPKRSKSAKSSALSTPNNGRVHASGSGSKTRRQPSAEMESVERRNLHNDMERQRRIGLKNLFDNLKDRIPSLRSKQRAPKVNILREATLLCTKLTQQNREYEQQLQRKHQLQQRLKFLREQVAARNYNGVYQ